MVRVARVLLPLYLVLASLLISACRTDSPSGANPVCDTGTLPPDSALAILDSIDPFFNDFSDSEKCISKPLGVGVRDKAFIPCNYDDDILRLIETYKRNGKIDELLKSYYYTDDIFGYDDELPYFLLVYLDAAESRRDGPRYLDKSDLYRRTGDLFHMRNLPQKAVAMYRNSAVLDLRAGDTAMAIYDYYKLGHAYSDLRMRDSSYASFKNACRLAMHRGCETDIYFSKVQLAAFYILSGDVAKAAALLPMPVRLYPSSDSSVVYSVGLSISMNTGADSYAHDCADSLLRVGNDFGRQFAYKCLSRMSFDNGDRMQAFRYLDRYEAYTDSIERVRAVEGIARMRAFYDIYKSKRDAVRLVEKHSLRRERQLASVLMVLIAGGLLVAVVKVYRRRKKRASDRIALLEALNSDLRKKNADNMAADKMRIASLVKEIAALRLENSDKAAQLELQRQKLDIAVKKVELNVSEQQYLCGRLKQSDVYRLIERYLVAAKPFGNAEWKTVNGCVEALLPELKRQIKLTLGFSEHEYRICLLLLFGLSPTDMAVLLSCSKSAVSQARSRMFYKIKGKSGKPKDFDDFIISYSCSFVNKDNGL